MLRILAMLGMLWVCQPTTASEKSALAEIMYGEARGTSIESAASIGEAALKRAKRTHQSVHALAQSGAVKPKPIRNKGLRRVYEAVASSIIANPPRLVGDADSWNRGHKPAYKGSVRRHIGGQTIYHMARL